MWKLKIFSGFQHLTSFYRINYRSEINLKPQAPNWQLSKLWRSERFLKIDTYVWVVIGCFYKARKDMVQRQSWMGRPGITQEKESDSLWVIMGNNCREPPRKWLMAIVSFFPCFFTSLFILMHLWHAHKTPGSVLDSGNKHEQDMVSDRARIQWIRWMGKHNLNMHGLQVMVFQMIQINCPNEDLQSCLKKSMSQKFYWRYLRKSQPKCRRRKTQSQTLHLELLFPPSLGCLRRQVVEWWIHSPESLGKTFEAIQDP